MTRPALTDPSLFLEGALAAAALAGPPTASLHQLLREATTGPHERLHGHPGFAAVKNGTISVADYTALLACLYGFHRPFEAAAEIGADRSASLRDDLAALGADPAWVAGLPSCGDLPVLDSPNRRLGALYVIEGSALGGLSLARGLDPLFGPGGRDGRQFFLGRGQETGPAWKSLLARLAIAERHPFSGEEIVSAAVEVFEAFEDWLRRWRQFANV